MPITSEDKKIFSQHRQHLVESRRLAYEQFDKSVFILAGGGLTISLTLIEKIIPFSSAVFKSSLGIAWSFFTLSILLTLYSFIVSQKSLDYEIQKIDDFLGKENFDALSRSNPKSKVTQLLNNGSFSCFLIAISALILFVFVNLSQEKPSQNQDKGEVIMSNQGNNGSPRNNGYVPPTAPASTPNRGYVPPHMPNVTPESGYIPPSMPVTPTTTPSAPSNPGSAPGNDGK